MINKHHVGWAVGDFFLIQIDISMIFIVLFSHAVEISCWLMGLESEETLPKQFNQLNLEVNLIPENKISFKVPPPMSDRFKYLQTIQSDYNLIGIECRLKIINWLK